MGKKLINALICCRRSSKTAYKLNMLANLAISRIAIIKNLHTVKFSQAESDVIQLLHLGYQQRALIRVEQVIKEQNALDAYVLIENYCHLLVVERTGQMLKNSRECPDELKETVSTLIFAASRCGEFPELQEIRALITSKFGKEFAKSSVELRNNCGVYPKMIQRFSTQQTSMESRQNLLKQIAKHNGITLQLDHEHEAFDTSNKAKCKDEQLHKHISNKSATFEAHKTNKAIPVEEYFHEVEKSSGTHSESVKAYRDVETAAQDAFESAAYAAAATAAVELSRVESWDDDSSTDLRISETQIGKDEEAPGEVNYFKQGLKSEFHS